jgi:hypothetical protein
MTRMIAIQESQDTTQRIDNDKARAKFLRRVMREEGWSLRADGEDGWKIVFSRTIKGEPGSPNVTVKVELDDTVSVRGYWGNQKSFEDAETVFVPKPTYLCLDRSDLHIAAKFLAEGSHLYILGSAGSSNSSKHGIAFVSLHAQFKGTGGSVTIGGITTYVNGRCVCSGEVGC